MITYMIYKYNNYRYHQMNEQDIPSIKRVIDINNRKYRSLFVYLIQTEKCFKDLWKVDGLLGESFALILSFKEACNDANKPLGWHYLFKSNLTWTEGRNFLVENLNTVFKDYSHCFENKHGILPFMYYILMDDDIHLTYSQHYNTTINLSALRFFEKWLLEDKPAIGSVIYCDNRICSDDKYPEYFQAHCFKSRPLILNNYSSNPWSFIPRILSIGHFDAIFNAIHRDTLNILLPYNSTFDHVNWWASQMIFNVNALKHLKDGVIQVNRNLKLNNKLHREYPKNHILWKDVIIRDESLMNALDSHDKHLLHSNNPYFLQDTKRLCVEPTPIIQSISTLRCIRT